MNTETRQCQNCQNPFTIEPEDFAFYEKIKVPPPTFCPQCRFQRRLTFMNWLNLYRRPCNLCKRDVISVFAPEAPYVVYCPKCWWSDDWDFTQYGEDVDFSQPFLEQYNKFIHKVPLQGLAIDVPTTELAPYTNHAGHLKNCYLLFFGDFNEDCAYGVYISESKSTVDSSLITVAEFIYDSMHVYKCHNCIGLRSQVTESLDCAFLRDCMNCQNCFASANLRNKKYHIFNKPHSKENYFEEIKKWDLGSYKIYRDVEKLAEEHWRTMPPKPTMDEFTTGCTGSHVFQSKNCKECFEVVGAEDSKYLAMLQLAPTKDCYDVSSWGNNMSLVYDSSDIGENISRVRFCAQSGINFQDGEYAIFSTGGAHHFGCVSVKKGEYYILNKKYSRDDYEKLTTRIREHMNVMPYRDKKGRVYKYGEFFPIELSPWAYNESVAQQFFPLSRSEAESSGYFWREINANEYTVTLPAADLPDHIRDAKDDILEEVVGCSQCGRGFKIIPFELSFLRKMNVPLPRRCPFCRINEKFNQWAKNLRVIPRTCYKCGAAFTTNYAEGEAPHILCRQCYLGEVV